MRWEPALGVGALFGVASALDCTSSAIQAILPSNASVNFAQVVSANSTFEVPKSYTGYPESPVGLPASCAVSVQVQSIENTTYGFGLFLPEDWNGRFLAVGNGGFGGGINWLDMSPGVRYGLATMSTDTGHNSSSVDGLWAYEQPAKQENWGHLAMHGSAVTAKSIIAAYYNQTIAYNYYAGCSTGGRQGLKEAELYPEDFDGIIAAAPAWWTSHLQPWSVKMASYNLPTTAAHHIPPSLFPLIQAEVLKQCDPQDGLTDGIISSPHTCIFRPETLLCTTTNPQNTSTCLTSPQLTTLDNIYAPYTGENQTFFMPGLSLSSETNFRVLLGSSAPNTLGTHYMQYFMGLGPDWAWQDFTDETARHADALDPGHASVGFDLSAFSARGGKLLSYHGMSDGHIPTDMLKYLHQQITRTLAPRGISVHDFFRTFYVPGMGHCSGTVVDAPWYFAGPGQASDLGPMVHGVPGFEDAEHDALLAMMAWVEDGRAPERIVGTKFEGENVGAGVRRQRPLCVWPAEARYKGTGDVDRAESWECMRLGE
ncbi:similar to feruloyl esterase B precursor [Plenodomus lingam JN3]|uniref:Carboxylic ester hydrolase n=2 Tax=Leptosphaeria maculans TaxID=5022 RepID=E5A9H3_LEPMJ|nr:similar to feruloyl esterase B precursor [Plenodomus lingam JN3]CBY00314.1 similar to feruloyl esterase B precursor [Plenodomus lingam JN3]